MKQYRLTDNVSEGRSLRKLIAISLSITLLFSSTTPGLASGTAISYLSSTKGLPAATPLSGFDPEGITIPEAFGTVEETYRGTTGKTVLFIQDAHESLDAQQNIAKLIGHAVRNLGVRTVYEEGYEGPVPTDEFFGFIPEPDVKEKVSFFLMDRLRLSGAEYAHINRKSARDGGIDFKLLGADSIKLHLENIRSYQRSARDSRQTARYLSAIHQELTKLADRYFPKEMKTWIRLKDRFQKGEMDFVEYLKRVKALNASSGPAADFAARYPETDLLLRVQASQNRDIEKQIKTVHARTLFSELDRLENDLSENYLRNDRDRKIFQYHKGLSLVERLNQLEVTQPEYEAAKGLLDQIRTEEMADFIVAHTHQPMVVSKKWEESIRNAVRFYEIAEARDRVIGETLGRFLNDDQENTAVLVFGGFHKSNIRQMLEAKGLSYCVITPKIKAIDTRHREYYKRLMSVGHYDYEISANVATASRTASTLTRAIEMGTGPIEAELEMLAAVVRSELRNHLEDPFLFKKMENRLRVEAKRNLERLKTAGPVPSASVPDDRISRSETRDPAELLAQAEEDYKKGFLTRGVDELEDMHPGLRAALDRNPNGEVLLIGPGLGIEAVDLKLRYPKMKITTMGMHDYYGLTLQGMNLQQIIYRKRFKALTQASRFGSDPETLAEDLATLLKTHFVERDANQGFPSEWSGHFNVVIVGSVVFSYLDEQAFLLEEIFRVLAPNGEGFTDLEGLAIVDAKINPIRLDDHFRRPEFIYQGQPVLNYTEYEGYDHELRGGVWLPALRIFKPAGTETLGLGLTKLIGFNSTRMIDLFGYVVNLYLRQENRGVVTQLSESRDTPGEEEPEVPWDGNIQAAKAEFQGFYDSIWKRGGQLYEPGTVDSFGPFEEMARYNAGIDALLKRLLSYTARIYPEEAGAVALVATGDYGRRELNAAGKPTGKILLRSSRPASRTVYFIQDAIQKIFGASWPAENQEQTELVVEAPDGETAERIKSAEALTAMLDGRLIAGHEGLHDTVLQKYAEGIKVQREEVARSLILLWNDRYREAGYFDSLFEREPDVLDGVGGLRAMFFARRIAQVMTGDRVHPFEAMAARGLMSPAEHQSVQRAWRFMCRLQSALHILSKAKKPSDVLSFEIQEDVATYLGYAGDPARGESAAEQMLHDYYRASWELFRFSYKVIRRFGLNLWPMTETAEPQPRGELSARLIRRTGVTIPMERGLVEIPAGESRLLLEPLVSPEPDTVPELAPETVLPLFNSAVTRQVRFGGLMLDAIENTLPAFQNAMDETAFRDEALDRFLWLLAADQHESYALATMHYLGILSALFPEFGQLTARTRRDIHTRYTLDAQAVRDFALLDSLLYEPGSGKAEPVMGEASKKLLAEIKNRQLLRPLRLALLFRPLARVDETAFHALIERLFLPERERALVRWLVRHEGDLIELIRRRGLESPEEFSDFILRDLEGNYDRWLLLLMATFIRVHQERPDRLLLYADELKHAAEIHVGAFVDQNRLRQLIASQNQKRAEEIDAQFPMVNEPEVRTQVAIEMLADLNTARVTVYHRQEEDAPGRLAVIAGALAANGLEILSVKVSSVGRPGNLADVFTVRDMSQGRRIDILRGLRSHAYAEDAWRDLKHDLERDVDAVLEGRKSVADIFEHRRQKPYAAETKRTRSSLPIPTTVSFYPNGNFTWMRVETEDRPLLLYVLTRIISSYGISILPASTIDTEGYDARIGQKAVDTFALSFAGVPLTPEQCEALRRDLTVHLARQSIDCESLDRYVALRQYHASVERFIESMRAGTAPVVAEVPDVHGDYERMMQALTEIDAAGVHQIVFLGDYLHRGREGLKCYREIRRRVETEGAVALLGNHELVFMKAILGGSIFDFSDWLKMGGWDIIREVFSNEIQGIDVSPGREREVDTARIISIVQNHPEIRQAAEWMRDNLKLYHRDANGTFHIHAGFDLRKTGEERIKILLSFEGASGGKALERMADDMRQNRDFKGSTAFALLGDRHTNAAGPLWTARWHEVFPQTLKGQWALIDFLMQLDAIRLNFGHDEQTAGQPGGLLAVTQRFNGLLNALDFSMSSHSHHPGAGGYMLFGGRPGNAPAGEKVGLQIRLFPSRETVQTQLAHHMTSEMLISEAEGRLRMIEDIMASLARSETRRVLPQKPQYAYDSQSVILPSRFDPDKPVNLAMVISDVDYTAANLNDLLAGTNLDVSADLLERDKGLVFISGSPYGSVYQGLDFRSQSLKRRVEIPLRRKLARHTRLSGQEDILSRLSRLRLYYISGKGQVTFDPRTGRAVILEEHGDKIISGDIALAVGRALAAGLEGVVAGRRFEEFSQSDVWKIIMATAGLEHLEAILKSKLPSKEISFWWFGTELALIFFDRDFPMDGATVVNAARRILTSAGVSLPESAYFFTSGPTFAKVATIRKRDVILNELKRARPKGIVLAFGDSLTDDFLWLDSAEIPEGIIYIPVYLGKASDVKDYPHVIVARDALGGDNVRTGGFGRIIRNCLDAEKAALTGRDLKLFDGWFSMRELEAQKVKVEFSVRSETRPEEAPLERYLLKHLGGNEAGNLELAFNWGPSVGHLSDHKENFDIPYFWGYTRIAGVTRPNQRQLTYVRIGPWRFVDHRIKHFIEPLLTGRYETYKDHVIYLHQMQGSLIETATTGNNLQDFVPPMLLAISALDLKG
ncbi:MAG: metallophosphoesterase, partial [Candidatus Omnitrophica bacterium]|nr:metallophosphoesterase [Candidatus Omnitrophota bacterium]